MKREGETDTGEKAQRSETQCAAEGNTRPEFEPDGEEGGRCDEEAASYEGDSGRGPRDGPGEAERYGGAHTLSQKHLPFRDVCGNLTPQLSCERIHKMRRRSRRYHSSFVSFNVR